MTSASKRVLFVLPCTLQDNRGNATSASRIADSLQRRGYQVELALAGSDSQDWPEFDVAIAFHAAHSGPQTHKLAAERNKPFVIAFTGTDLNGKPQAATTAAVEHAAMCVALCNSAARRARDLFASFGGGLEVIFEAVAQLPYKPGAKLPEFAPALEKSHKLVLVPAGVREIKDPLRAVKALTALAAIRPEMRLWFVGPELDAAYGELLRSAIAELDWASWIGEVPRAELLPLMRRADVVLSTSRSEGAAPNSLLEAALAGAPVLASDIPAHREFPGSAFCFRDDRLLRRKLESVFDEPGEAAREVRKLQEIVRFKHGVSTEQLAWDRLLGAVIYPEKPRKTAKPLKLRKSELPKKRDQAKGADRAERSQTESRPKTTPTKPAKPDKPTTPKTPRTPRKTDGKPTSPWDRAREKRDPSS
jgi:glycosyltransferase involved in cell wall biosynthesis